MAQHYTPEYEVGEVIAVRTSAKSPFKRNRSTILGLTGKAEIFAPSKDPQNVPADRGSPDAEGDFAYIEGEGYVAFVDTAGLTPAGVWTLRARLNDAANNTYDNVEYVTFQLKE